jgi:hypothetical protein
MHHHNAEDCSDCLTQADNASYDIDTCGTDTFSFQKKDRGIHSVWAQRVDELIEGGVLPAKVLRCLQKKATEITRPLLPHLSQIHNRKKTVFRATTIQSAYFDTLHEKADGKKLCIPLLVYIFLRLFCARLERTPPSQKDGCFRQKLSC